MKNKHKQQNTDVSSTNLFYDFLCVAEEQLRFDNNDRELRDRNKQQKIAKTQELTWGDRPNRPGREKQFEPLFFCSGSSKGRPQDI